MTGSRPRRLLVSGVIAVAVSLVFVSGDKRILQVAEGSSPPPTAPFVYVANSGGGTLSQFGSGAGGLLAPLSSPTVGTGASPNSVAVSPDGQHAYVTDRGDNAVSQYTAAADGTLTPLSPPTIPAGGAAAGIAISPDGKNAYVADYNDGTVSQYTVDAGGALTPMTPPTVAAGSLPFGVALNAAAKVLYVTNSQGADSTVSQYTIGADGGLTAMNPPKVATGATPGGITVTPDGKYAYVADQLGNTISQYTVGVGGALTPMTPPTVAAGNYPFSIAVTPNGTSAYATDNQGATISQYTIGAGGALTPMTPATVAAGTNPYGLTITADGAHLYATNAGDNTISQYTIGATGALTPASPPTVPTGGTPAGIATAPPQSTPAPPPPPPKGVAAAFTLPSGVVRRGSLITLDASASRIGGASVASYQWSINGRPSAVCDGSTSLLQTRFLSAGTKTVSLQAVSALGAVTTAQHTLIVAPATGANIDARARTAAASSYVHLVPTQQVFACGRTSGDPSQVPISATGLRCANHVDAGIVDAEGCLFNHYEQINVSENTIALSPPIFFSAVDINQALPGNPLPDAERLTLLSDIEDYYVKNPLGMICKNGPVTLKASFCQESPGASGPTTTPNGSSSDQATRAAPVAHITAPVAHSAVTTVGGVPTTSLLPNTGLDTPCSQVIPLPDHLGSTEQPACLDLYVSSTPVVVNGLEYRPQGNAVVVIAPQFNLVISSSAEVWMGAVRLKPAQAIDYQLPDQSQAAYADYPALDAPSIQALADQSPAARAELGLVGGLPTTGGVHISFSDFKAEVTLSAQLPSIFSNGSGGPVTVTIHGELSNTTGFHVISGSLSGSADLGPVALKNFGVCFRAHASPDPNVDPCPGITGIAEDPSFGDNFWDATGELDAGVFQLIFRPRANDPAASPTCPFTPGIGLNSDGSLKFVGAVSAFTAPIELAPGVTLDEIGAGFTAEPEVDTLCAYAKLGVGGGLAQITGNIFAAFGNYQFTGNELGAGNLMPSGSPPAYPRTSTFAIGVGGILSVNLPVLGSVNVGHGYVLYADSPPAAFFGAGYDFSVPTGYTYRNPPSTGIGISGGIDGGVGLKSPYPFFIEGHVSSVGQIDTGDLPPGEIIVYRGSLDAIVSTTGIGLCGTVSYLGSPNVTGGIGYHWGDGILKILNDFHAFGSCNDDWFTSLRVNPQGAGDARARDARAAASVIHVPRGANAVDLYLTGRGGAPDVTISGPGGFSATTAGTPADKTTLSGRVLRVRVPQLDRTNLAISDPVAGTYRITLNPGSPPLTSIRQDNGIAASVRASVTGRGIHRRLVYEITPEPGQAVVFMDSTRGRVTQVLGTVHGSRGSISLSATPGGGRRYILAEVIVNGTPGAHLTVASYTPPSPVRLPRVRRLRVTRSGANATISFNRVRGATAYSVYVALQDGGRRLYRTRAASLTVHGIFSEVAGLVTVRAIGDNVYLLTGPPSHAKLSSAIRFRKVTDGRKHRR